MKFFTTEDAKDGVTEIDGVVFRAFKVFNSFEASGKVEDESLR
jgi:hypothetical protein